MFYYFNCYLWYSEAKPLNHAYFHVDSLLFVCLLIHAYLSLDTIWKPNIQTELKKRIAHTHKMIKMKQSDSNIHIYDWCITSNLQSMNFVMANTQKQKKQRLYRNSKELRKKWWLLYETEIGNWSYLYCSFTTHGTIANNTYIKFRFIAFVHRLQKQVIFTSCVWKRSDFIQCVSCSKNVNATKVHKRIHSTLSHTV